MPRRSRGALLPPIPAPRVRRGDVYRALRDAMLDGTLGQGVLLPSTRMLAVEYGMSRTTIEDVYDQLVSEGLIERSIGRGSFVAGLWPAPARHTPGPVLRLSRRGERLGANAACREPLVLRPFNAGVPDVSLFPWKVWERCWRRAQEALGREGLNHCDSAGYRPLRVALASYLAQSRGVRARPEQVVVFNSTAQALHTLFLLLLDRGDTLWVEEPGYPGVRAAAHLVEAKAVPVPVDEDGILVSAGRKLARGARLAYVTPAHQYPTGAWLTHERRRQLLEWAAERGAVIVEDDYDADFRYHGEPLTTLYALDGGQRVLYVGTLSKATFLGLRVAYAVLPEPLVEQVGNVRAQVDSFPPIVMQAALTAFIDGGHLAAHVRQMRRAYASKRSQALERLAPMIARGWTPGPSAAGMHFVLYEPSAGLAKRLAQSSRLALTPLSAYGRPLSRDGLSIRFGGLTAEQIDAGARELCAAVKR